MTDKAVSAGDGGGIEGIEGIEGSLTSPGEEAAPSSIPSLSLGTTPSS